MGGGVMGWRSLAGQPSGLKVFVGNHAARVGIAQGIPPVDFIQDSLADEERFRIFVRKIVLQNFHFHRAPFLTAVDEAKSFQGYLTG